MLPCLTSSADALTHAALQMMHVHVHVSRAPRAYLDHTPRGARASPLSQTDDARARGRGEVPHPSCLFSHPSCSPSPSGLRVLFPPQRIAPHSCWRRCCARRCLVGATTCAGRLLRWPLLLYRTGRYSGARLYRTLRAAPPLGQWGCRQRFPSCSASGQIIHAWPCSGVTPYLAYGATHRR